MEQLYDCSPKVKASGFTELMHLVLNAKDPECIQKIKSLLSKDKEQIHSRNSEGWTPLHLACRNSKTKSSLEIVDVLINEGADVNAVTNNLQTPLLMVCLNTETDSHEELIDILINNGANVNAKTKTGVTPFFCNELRQLWGLLRNC